MEVFLIKALQLFLSLSILVIVHEFGHFIVAKLFKIRVEKFYLFFDPGFALFRYKPKNSDTEFGIGWLPLGGYVKISGMIDESFDTAQMAQEPKPWEFRTKPAWQRLLVMAAGAVFNFILAWFIYCMMLFAWGDTYISTKDLKNGMTYSEIAKEVGFKDGDKLVSVDGEDFIIRGGILSTNSMMKLLDAKEITVEREGKDVLLEIPSDFGERVIGSKKGIFQQKVLAIVDSVVQNSNAERAGFMKGDSIVKVNDVIVNSFSDFQQELMNGADRSYTVQVYRDTALITMADITLKEGDTMGIIVSSKDLVDAVKTNTYSFLGSLSAGTKLGFETLKAYVSQMRFLFSKEGLSNLGGFGTMGSMFSPVWDWHYFWMMTAFLSIALGFLNLVPIPMLDGGHIMFLLYEVITRRKPSDKFMEHAQIIGLLIVLSLIIIANGNDIIRAFF